MAVFAYALPWVFYPLSFCTIVSARPLSTTQSYDTEPLIIACPVIFLVLLLLLAVKLVYAQHRRLSVIRSRDIQSTLDVSLNSRSSILSLKAAQLKATRFKCTPFLGILVGCLGSPAWETDIESDFDSNSTRQRRTASFMYQLHRQSKQRSSYSYSAAHRSSKSLTAQVPASQAQLTCSTSFFSLSSEHSPEDATRKPGFRPPPNIRVLTYPTKARSRKTATIQRYSLLIDNPISGQQCDFCEKCNATGSSFRARNLCTPSNRTTSGVDIGPSLRLVGATDVTAVPYSFLSAFPPSSYVLSPLTGTRDSLQLSRFYSRSTRKPVPPLPPLPSYSLLNERSSDISLAKLPAASSRPPTGFPQILPPLEFSPPNSTGSFCAVADQVPAHLSTNTPLLPTDSSKLETSPPVSVGVADYVATVKLLPDVLHPSDPLVFAVQKMKRKTTHKRSPTIRSRSGTIPGASPLRIMALPEDMSDRKPVGDTPTGDKENSTPATCTSKATDDGKIHRSLKDASNRLSLILNLASPDAQLELSTLSHSARSIKSTKSLARSDAEGSLSDLSSLQTPKSDRLDEVDISMLGLDRFHWSEEGEELIKSHIKNDSVALISFWEEGQWMRENN
ncbi:uncharacterized protein EDB91DRAFT_1245523 [Suillus paluster]|uniref:uncharacterized protein n=1 Tax=Suillus paluster TaxID=48578 RepID=UPI001B885F8D|nr:uncharacterized protein EDB91DRAFT_1245523 [Suillus paluster]KAG1747080.1 hypothetical protein EDB91DRAFT_1245523 [Suillus paluster]